MALNGGAIPVCVVSSPEKAELVPARWAPSWSSTAPPRATGSGRTSTPRTPRSGSGSGKRIRELTGGEDPDIVFEHPGRETFGASVYVAKRGGTIVTCASTAGYMHQYDNRYLWMNLKRIIGSHFANYREAWEANRLIARGPDPPDAVQGLPAGATSARPPTTCTATCTRARSACSAWRPRRGSASATPSCAPGTWTRSTASAGV